MRDFGALFLLTLIALSAHQHGNLIYVPLGYIALYLAALYWRERRNRERDLFIYQLKSLRAELRAGATVSVDQLLLTYQTELTTFRVKVGALISSVEIPSRFHRFPAHGHGEQFIYSLCTLTSGWWCIPGGPLHTLGILLQNVSGGEKKRVCELIDGRRLSPSESSQSRIVIVGGFKEVSTPVPRTSTNFVENTPKLSGGKFFNKFRRKGPKSTITPND